MSKQTIVIALIIVYILIHSLFLEPNSIKITRYEIESNALTGVRAAFLSDLHLGVKDYKRLDRIVQLTIDEKPDILFLGGDFVKSLNHSKNMSINVIAGKLNMLNVPKYAVLGDDDWRCDAKEITSVLSKNKIMVLENSPIRTIIKNRYIDIIGVKDIQTRDANVAKAMRRTRLPRIVLSHNPDIYYDVVDDVTLILSGHTHGGQLVIPMTSPIFVPSRYGAQFASGLKVPKSNPIIISRGLGTDKFPFRFNCPPEIVIIDFIRTGTAK